MHNIVNFPFSFACLLFCWFLVMFEEIDYIFIKLDDLSLQFCPNPCNLICIPTICFILVTKKILNWQVYWLLYFTLLLVLKREPIGLNQTNSTFIECSKQNLLKILQSNFVPFRVLLKIKQNNKQTYRSKPQQIHRILEETVLGSILMIICHMIERIEKLTQKKRKKLLNICQYFSASKNGSQIHTVNEGKI